MATDVKKEGHLSSLILKTNISQAVDFILKEDRIDYKNTLKTIFKSMNCEEIEELLSIIKYSDINKYEALLRASNDLAEYNESVKGCIYAFETKIDNKFYALYNDAKNSLNTGDLIAFLLNRYFYYKKRRNKIIDPASNYILKDIVESLIEIKALLVPEIKHQLYLPISKALFVFFIYDKVEAFSKFKNIITKDLLHKNTTLYELEYQATANIFFDRLGLDYIPSIDISPEKNDIVISEKKKYINKEELLDEIDKDDFFNNKIPLSNFEHKKLINSKKNTKDLRELTKSLSLLFYDFYKKNDDFSQEYDLIEVFMENITQPYPKYSKEVLIRVREILKDMFLNNKDFKYSFFAIIFIAKLPGWTNKIPKILSNYLGRTKGLGCSSIEKFFHGKSKNPINPYFEKIPKYVIYFTPRLSKGLNNNISN